MRRLAACVALSVWFVAPMAGEPMKAGDRQRLLAHLEMSESWSITDVTEHLAIAEPQYWQRVNDSMKQPATTDKIEATDAGILWYGIDRTNRQKTGEARVPHGTFKSAADALAAFRKLRATMREYAQATSDDLRSRTLLEGNMDVYQWFLMISTHSQRHILQIREVKAHAGYPKQ